MAFSVAVAVACLFQIDTTLPVPRSVAAYAAIGLSLAQTLVMFVRKQGSWAGSLGAGPLVVLAGQGFADHSVTVALSLAVLASPLMYGPRSMFLVRIAGVAGALPFLAITGTGLDGQPAVSITMVLIPMLVLVAFGVLIRIVLNASVIQEESDLRQALLEAISAARDEAVAASAAKGAFLGTMSHELRTPLNAVIGLADLVLATPLDAQQQDLVRTIAGSGEKLLKIIDDILDFSQMEAGRGGLSEKAFDLGALVSDTVGSFTAAAAGLGLSVEFDEDVETAVLGHPDHLRKILSQLIDNAIKFTAAGEVSVRVRRSAPAVLGSVAEGAGGDQAVLFEITDTGAGIAPEHIARLMEPFDQIDPSTTRAYGGAGLGLALARALTLEMGGTLSVDSTLGSGSTFSVVTTFMPDPVRRSQAGPAAVPAGLEQPPGHPRAVPQHPSHVLLVEDDQINQKVGSLILTKLGCPFDIAENGQLAVTAAQSGHYDIILMDMRMPVMDGLEATRQSRAQLPPERQPTIVALTANVTQADRMACSAAGMDDFLGKPVRSLDVEAIFAHHTVVTAG